MKLTDTQKKFRKEMKNLEKQGYTFENPRAKTVKFIDKKAMPLSIIGILVLIWNIFALSSYLPSISSSEIKASQLINNKILYNKSSDHEEIANYLIESDELDLFLEDNLNTLIMYLNDRNNHSELEVISLIDKFQGNIPSEKSSIEELNKLIELDLKRYNKAYNLLIFSRDNYYSFNENNVATFNNLYQDYINTSMAKRDALINLFNSKEIDFKILDNGSLEYTINN